MLPSKLLDSIHVMLGRLFSKGRGTGTAALELAILILTKHKLNSTREQSCLD